MTLEFISGVVVGQLTAGVGKVVAAPLDAVADLVRARVRDRLDRMASVARAKASGRPLDVSDRVAAKVLNEAAWVDDEVTVDYLGGVLAASHSADDTGAAMVALIGRLSSLDLKLHYVIYREVRRLWNGPPTNPYGPESQKYRLRIPHDDLVAVFTDQHIDRLASSMTVLIRESLVRAEYQASVEEDGPYAGQYTLRVRPNGAGADLFLWGHGVRPLNRDTYFDQSLDLVFLSEVPETPGAVLSES